MIEQLKQALAEAEIQVTGKQAASFVHYYQLLRQWNTHTNLTAITDFSEFIVKHIADSLIPLRYIATEGATVADVGSGAGFPGIPLQIVKEDINMTLLDSARKRTDFLVHCCRELALEARVVQTRAEEAGQSPLFRETFDLVVSRAVAPLPVLCELCLPLVRQGGIFAAMKGPKAGEELDSAAAAIKLLGGFLAETIDYSLPGGDPRTLVVFIKKQSTPARYPRRVGIPNKRPLA